MTTDEFIEDMRVTIERRIADAVAVERERCAKIAQDKGCELSEAAIGRFISDAIKAAPQS